MEDPIPHSPRRPFAIAVRLLVALLLALILGYVGYLGIALGPRFWTLTLTAVVRGEERILMPAALRGAPLRKGERVYLLTTQAERIVPLRFMRRSSMGPPRNFLHVDLWAFDVATAIPAWRQRLRTFEDGGQIMFEILGVDGGTLWLLVREPLAIALGDGTILADGARLETLNPPLAGKRVDRQGWVAFGAQGLQLTLSDSTQWVVDGATLKAEPRTAAPRARDSTGVPAVTGPTASFQMRGLPIGTRWLGVLTDQEAASLAADPVVPGAKPGERRGVMADFLARDHVPQPLTAQPKPYRLWSARVAQVSAAPLEWPKELPDNWGTRDQFSDYAPLPEAPTFLQAGLLGDSRAERPFWLREPDSVIVLHPDKVGGSGLLYLTRVAGPAGRVVWDAALPLGELNAVMFDPRTLALVGTEPNPRHNPKNEESREQHEKVVVVDVGSGTVGSYDVTAESVVEGGSGEGRD